ncbi:MAG: YlbF family regulator [Clostridia bacterium]|nr:YlbF family regulator [Clostridia bacterium]
MDIIEAARNLGVVLQQDERYKKYMEARKANDADEELQKLVGEFNLARMQVDNEFQKEEAERDNEKIREFNVQIRQIYGKIMCNDTMMEFNKAKADFDAVMQRVNGIIDMSIEGEDPQTCEPATGCTGSCATCGGCH